MSIQNTGSNRWLVRVRKLKNGKTHNRVKVIEGSRVDALKAEICLKEELAEQHDRSLKIYTFAEALQFYRDNTEADLTRVETLFNKLSREIGHVRIGELTARFTEYWRLLKTEKGKLTGRLLSDATRNRLLMYSKISLNFCMKRGLIQSNPLTSFDKLPELGRDRVLSEDEERRILNVMQRRNSYLLWPFLFSLKNPIRIGDLRALKRENLDYFKPWVHFYPAKTRKRKKKETKLLNVDTGILNYFKSLPGDCPFLFPRIDDKGNWHSIGDFKKHWYNILDEAGVKDFHWHDLKHCAITYMLDNGYSEIQLKTLGIQYTAEMIERYYHGDAEKILLMQKKRSNEGAVAHENGTFALGSL